VEHGRPTHSEKSDRPLSGDVDERLLPVDEERTETPRIARSEWPPRRPEPGAGEEGPRSGLAALPPAQDRAEREENSRTSGTYLHAPARPIMEQRGWIARGSASAIRRSGGVARSTKRKRQKIGSLTCCDVSAWSGFIATRSRPASPRLADGGRAEPDVRRRSPSDQGAHDPREEIERRRFRPDDVVLELGGAGASAVARMNSL